MYYHTASCTVMMECPALHCPRNTTVRHCTTVLGGLSITCLLFGFKNTRYYCLYHTFITENNLTKLVLICDPIQRSLQFQHKYESSPSEEVQISTQTSFIAMKFGLMPCLRVSGKEINKKKSSSHTVLQLWVGIGDVKRPHVGRARV